MASHPTGFGASATAAGLFVTWNFKKLLPRRYQQSQHTAVDAPVGKLLTPRARTPGQSTAATDPQPLHTNHTIRPRVMHNLAGAPSSADTMLSTHCTGLNTVTEISTKFVLQKRALGTSRSTPRITTSKPRVSLISISFQDGLRRSTVVVRQPVRSSKRSTGTGVRRRGAPGVEPLKLALLFEVIEGTQWTWRRPPSA